MASGGASGNSIQPAGAGYLGGADGYGVQYPSSAGFPSEGPPQRGGPSGLSARQRKQVYMHSSIFDPQGPSTRSVYAPQRQQVIYHQLEPELPKKDYEEPEFQARLDLPPPGDMRQTQNHGHDLVFHHPDGDEEAIRVVHARPETNAIPPEFRRTDVNLHWADQRNELNRPRAGFGGIRDRELSARDWKNREMSSELFEHQRMSYNSTDRPREGLQVSSKHFLQCDSRVDAHERVRTSDMQQFEDQGRDQTAQDRYYTNLGDSQANTFPDLEQFYGQKGHGARPPSPTERGPHPVTMPLDNKENLHRRRTEKNYSDLFGYEMGSREQVKQREEATATQTCSWLDARSEIAARNTANMQEKESPMLPAAKKQQQLSSHMLGYWGPAPKQPETQEEREVTKAERVCWDTNSILTASAEVARRAQHKDFHPRQETAHERKLEQLSSSVFPGDKYNTRGSLGPPTSHGWEKVYKDENNNTYLAVRGPEPGVMNGAGPGAQMIRPPTAREQKLASLAGSSIFGDDQ